MMSCQSPELVIQMEMSSLLTLDAIDRPIGDFLVGLPVQRPADRKTPSRPVWQRHFKLLAGLTAETRNAALRLLPCVASEFAMNDVVERILNAYQLMRPLDAERVSDSRLKITKYIESLSTAGHRDAEQLTIYGLAYLKELHEGRDPRFTGC